MTTSDFPVRSFNSVSEHGYGISILWRLTSGGKFQIANKSQIEDPKLNGKKNNALAAVQTDEKLIASHDLKFI